MGFQATLAPFERKTAVCFGIKLNVCNFITSACGSAQVRNPFRLC